VRNVRRLAGPAIAALLSLATASGASELFEPVEQPTPAAVAQSLDGDTPDAGDAAAAAPPRQRGLAGWVSRLLGRERPDGADVAADGRTARYALEVEAPEPLEALVRNYTLLGRWRFRDDFDPAQLPLFVRRARGEIEELLAAEGFFEPEVTVTQIKNGANVLIVAGPRTTVNLADVRLTGPISDDARYSRLHERLRDAWLLPEGSFFRSNEWERAKRELLQHAHDEGFLRARVTASEAVVNLETTAVSLHVELESGPRIAFGEIEIGGLQRYPPQVVRGLRNFRPGDPYRQGDVAEFQIRLNGSGYFSTVSIRPDVDALEEDETLLAVPIRVQVVELESKRLTLGGGYDTDRGFNVLLGWENKNLFDIGLQSLSGLELDLQRQLAYSTLSTPYDANGRRWQGGVRGEHNDVQNDIVDAASLFVSRSRLVDDTETALSLQLQFERQSIVPSPGESIERDNQAAVLGYTWTRRRLDSPLSPSTGYVLVGQVSGASEELLSKRSFIRTYASGLRIDTASAGTLLEGSRLVIRGEAGIVFADASDGIPSQNLFRTGGARSVRGYASQSLGAKIGQATVGGRYLLVGSVEYQHPVSQNIHLAAFYDRGNAADSRSGFSTVAGYGVGLRWRTPVGPLNLDVAYGEAISEWRLHFSIGVVF
jgi:translocation and assembly module TamA